MISHEEASLFIMELQQERLDAGRSEALRAHLAGCEDCRALSETCELLSDTLAGEARRSAAHPSSEEIVSYALADEETATPDLGRVGSHVQGCPPCLQEVEASRGAVAVSTGIVQSARSDRWLAPLAVAAGIVALLLTYPAYLGLVRAPAGGGEEPWPGGAVGSIYLDVLRSANERAPVAEVSLEPDRPYVAFMVEPTLPEGTEDNAPFRFSITGADGRKVWEEGLTAGEIRRHLESSSRAVILLVPSGALKPGRHALSLRAGDRRDQPPMLEIPFDVKG